MRRPSLRAPPASAAGLLALVLLQVSCLHQWLHPHHSEVVDRSPTRAQPPPEARAEAPRATDPTPPPPLPPLAPGRGPEASGSIDFTRIRTEFGEREDFDEVCWNDYPLGKFGQLMQAEQWQAALDVALRWLAACPVDIHARFVAAVSLSKLGRAPEAEEHRFWYWGLVQSVLASGDGRTPETAFVVISIPEEYAVLSALGLRWNGQTLRDGGIDEISIEGRAGSSVFFNPAALWRRQPRDAPANPPRERERLLPAA